MDFVDRLKNELDESADWNATVTVSRKDLEWLIAAYERLKKEEEE